MQDPAADPVVREAIQYLVIFMVAGACALVTHLVINGD